MKCIFSLFLYYPQRFFHLQMMSLDFCSKRMVIEMLLNNKILIFFFWIEFTFYIIMYIIEEILWINFHFSFEQIINKIWMIKLGFYVMFKWNVV